MKMGWTESLARACARRPWVTVAAWVAAIGLAVFLNITWLGDALVTDIKPTNNPESNQAQEIVDQRLGKSASAGTLDETIIVHSDTFTVDDAEFRTEVEQLYADLLALGPDVVLGGMHYYLTQAPMLVSPDRHSTMVPFTMPHDGNTKIQQIYALGDRYSRDSFSVLHTGSASFAADSMALGERQAMEGERFGIAAALVILAVVFGALAAAVLPLVLGGVAILVALGLAALVGQAMDLTFMITNMITMMGLAVGIDYSLFILTRFREERSKGLSKLDAIGKAGATASRAVFFSGMTVVLALSGLILFPLSIFISMGIGSILVVVMAIAASMTLLPAVISLLGDRVNAIRIPLIQGKQAQNYESDTGFWAWITRTVTRVPIASILVVVIILGVAAIPYFSKQSGMSGISTMPDSFRSKQGYLALQREFHIGLDAPAQIVIDGDINSEKTQAGIASLQSTLKSDPAFVTTTVTPHPDQNLAVITVSVAGDPVSVPIMNAVSRLRKEYLPRAFEGAPVRALVTGYSASILDFNATTSQYTPVIFIFVLALSFVILTLAFRSIVISTTAIIMNLLSIGAAYGLIVLVFQEGVGASLFGFTKVDVIETWLPLFLFALLFGLSMDYHVFLLSRIRERYKKTGHNAEAVSFGLRSTGRLITGAALIMVAVFGGFAIGDMTMFQQMGFGLAIAVLLDATLVRCVLVPATMTLLGNANWYLPGWLQWLPHVGLGENTGESTAAPPGQEKPLVKPIPRGLGATGK